MGSNTLESIINTICFYSSIHFSTTSAEEHQNMCWGNINLSVYGEGQKYLEFMERKT